MLDLKYRVRNIVSSLGANEVLTYNFVGSTLITNYNLDLENAFQLRNPLSPELEFMRINLIPSLCEKLKENINRGYTDVSLYEINMIPIITIILIVICAQVFFSEIILDLLKTLIFSPILG